MHSVGTETQLRFLFPPKMPYNTIGGFTALPGQINCGTVYEPRRHTTYLASQFPPQRTSKPAAEQRRVHHDNDASLPHHALPSTLPVSLPSINAATFSSSDFDVWGDDARRTEAITPHNLWTLRKEAANGEARRGGSADGAAEFRPRQYTALASTSPAAPSRANATLPSFRVSTGATGTAEAGHAVKPLLEPFLNAQELARQGSEETWHTRRLRYMQWLRKGARAAKQKEDAEEEEDAEADVSPPSTALITDELRATVDGSSSSPSGPSRHPSTARLPPLEHTGGSGTSRHQRDTRVFGQSELTLLQPAQLEASAFGGFPSLGVVANPNEVAVRRLFRLARGAPLTPASSPTAAHAEEGDGDGRATSVDSEGAEAVSPRRQRQSRSPRLGVGNAVVVPFFGEPSAYVDEDGFSFSCTAKEETGSEESGDSSSTVMKMAIEPPPEYGVAGLLRKRMHNTVASFTASSVHTLDAPPQRSTTPFFGCARLRGEDEVGLAVAPSAGEGVDDGRLQTPLSPTARQQQRALSPRAVRRLVYQETYERGLLLQLAVQSSPTRWYSSELPGGAQGIAFRQAYSPEMTHDAQLQARLCCATAHVMEDIARPRQEAAAGRQQRQVSSSSFSFPNGGDAQRRLISASLAENSVDGSVVGNHGSLADSAGVGIEVATREKEALFEQWTRLHRNLSAQWQLFQDEHAARLRLLGHFVSCAYPEPCVCLECDQEVLNMSAIPLEPTVKPLCWYTAVVLAQHYDVIQMEMLRQHEEGLAAMHDEFRILFIATYTREKLLGEEARRFNKMLHYHEFCLRVAAQDASTDSGDHSCNNRDCEEQAEEQMVKAEGESSQGVHLPTTTEERMWRLRQRRLQAYKAFDSPFFSYLVYTEMVTVASAEAQVRAMLVDEEAARRQELAGFVRRDQQYSALVALERRRRTWIAAEAMEAHSAMLSGPLVQLHAAHMAELRDKEAATHARLAAREQLVFQNAAFAEKQAVVKADYARYKMQLREIRQQFLTLLVADRSPASAVEVSRRWLHEQRQSVLIRSEQRLRDQLVLFEEPADFQTLLDAAAESQRATAEEVARRCARERAEAEAAAAEAAAISAQERARVEQEQWARLQRARMETDPRLRPSAKLPADPTNSYTKLTMTLNEDFLFFLPELD